MSRDSEEVYLYEVSSDALVTATLYEGLEEHNLIDHEQRWVPALESANDASRNSGGGYVAEDAHWRWSRKAMHSAGQLSFRHYAIEWNEKTVGLLMLKIDGETSKLEPGKPLVYIDYICVSPENRKVIKNPPELRGIGTILFHVAIEVAFEVGMHGRVGLHSLPKACNWYRDKLGLSHLGPDPTKSNLEYFELTVEQAQKLKNERNNKES